MVKTMPIVDTLLIILLICVLLPAVLTWVFDYILRKFKLIEDNDLKIISTDKK